MSKSSGENMNLVVETPYPKRYRALFANLAPPAIQWGLGLTAPRIGWVVLSFTRAPAAAIAPAARLADIWRIQPGLGEGGESQPPLARAVIGGLGSSTFSALFAAPGLYSLIKPGVTIHGPLEE